VENIRRQCNAVDWTSNTISEIFPWDKNVIKRRQAQLHAKTQTAKTICRYRKVKSLNTENYFIFEHLVNNLYLFKVCLRLQTLPLSNKRFYIHSKKKYVVFVLYLLQWFLHFWIITLKKPVWPVTNQDLSAILNNQILPGSKPVWLVWPRSLIGSQSSLCSSSI